MKIEHKWIESEKELPEIDRVVLAYNGKKIFTAHRFKIGETDTDEYFKSSICVCCQSDSCDYDDPITHWKPLPDVPE